jgi:hypothetical protein
MAKSEPIWEDIFFLKSSKPHCKHWWRNVIGKDYQMCCRKGCGATRSMR